MSAWATDGSWNADALGNWSDSTKWLSGAIADGQGAVGNLTFNISGNRAITIDTTGRTLGTLNIGDPTSPYVAYTLAASGGGTLTMNNGGSGAQINAISPSGNVSLSAPIILADNLTLTNQGNGTVTVSGAFSGVGDLTLKNNGTQASGITISGSVNHTGKVVNSGTGTAPTTRGTNTLSLDKSVTISGTIGSNVTGVVQDSATSVMDLTAANTYSGSTEVKAGTLILSHATAASSSEIVVGAASGGADAALSNRTVSIANTIRVQSGGSGSVTLGSAVATNSTFSGDVTLEKDVILSPYNGRLIFTGNIGGSGGITVSSTGRVVSAAGPSYGFTAGSVVLTRSSNTNTFSGDVEVLAGSLILSGSGASANITTMLGSGLGDVKVGANTGSEMARLLTEAGATGQSFNRNIAIQGEGGGITGVGSNLNNGFIWNSNVSLGKSTHLFNNGSNGSTNVVDFRGALVKNENALGAVSVTTSGGGVVKLSGANQYDGGSVAGGLGSVLWGSGAGSLGSGNLKAEMGIVRLDDQVALASDRGLHVGPYGGVGLGLNNAGQINYLKGILSADSSGSIVLMTGIGQTLNLADFGNGMMALGASMSSSSYTAGTLGANVDGNYRFGFGSARLDLTQAVLVGASAKVLVGAPSPGLPSTMGNLFLSGANTYGGGTEIFAGSTLRGKQQATSGSPFGSTTGTMTLHGASLLLESAGGATSSATTVTSLGQLKFDGSSTITLQGPTAGGGTNTLQIGELTRVGKGVIALGALTSGTLGASAMIKVSGTAPTTTTAGIAGGGSVQMVAPYFVDGSFASATDYLLNANFMGYDDEKGFYAITNAYTTLAGAPTNAIVKLGSATTVNSDQTIYALGITSPSGGFTITNTSGADKTLTITSGGVFFDARNTASINFGSSAVNQRINLDFAGSEAIFNTTTGNNQGLVYGGNISNASGLTKAGNGTLTLSGTGSSFEGDINLLYGGGNSWFVISNDLNLGGVGNALNNGVVFDGGKLMLDGNVTLSASRTLTIGASGGDILLRDSGNYGKRDVVIASKITGASGSHLLFQNFMAGGDANTAASTFRLTNTANDFVAPIFIGKTLGNAPLALVFDTDSQLGHASNSVSLVGGNAVLRYAGSGATTSNRDIQFLELGGSIEIFEASGELTVGGKLSGSGLFNKLGEGRLVLSGSSDYTGNTIVSSGALQVSHAHGLGATTAVISGSVGVSGGGVYVENGAALEVAGDIAVGGAGGKATYLSGHGIANAGALRNVSGSNSNAGAVVLRTASTIGSDAGRLTLSGEVRGAALTKVGAGSLELTGANSYTGGTVVSAGTLILNNTTGSATGTGDVTLAAGATLSGAGAISGVVTSNGTSSVISPGNSPGTLTLGGLDASEGVSFNFELGSVSDKLDLGSGVFSGSTSSGGLVFNLSEGAGLAEGNYTLITFGSSTGLDYSDIATNLALGNYTLDLTYGTNGFLIGANSLQVQITSIPETESTLLLVLGAGLMLILRRRRSKVYVGR